MNAAQQPRPGSTPRPPLDELRDHLTGTVTVPGDPGYDDARRVWNGMIDLRPAAVVRAGSVADVDPVLGAVQHTGLPLAVRGGGHGVAGHGTVEDGIVLDLGGLRTVAVDPDSREVVVAPGATLADVDAATAPHGLAVPLGVVSATGVAGLTLGGGVGWLTRTWGLALDSLLAADVVTGTREHLHASSVHNPDLFWGLRGGGGNLGVVTSFVFRARPLPAPVLTGTLVWAREHWRSALRAFGRWSQELPDAMNPIASFLRLPPEFGVGEDTVMLVAFAWADPDHAAGLTLVDRLRTAAPPDGEEIAPLPWPQWQSAMDGLFPTGSRGYWKNLSFAGPDGRMLDALVAVAGEVDWAGTGLDLHLMGGFFGRVPEGTTAFPNRSAQLWLNVYGFWQDPAEDERLTAFARSAHARLLPFADRGEYVNFLGAEAAPPGAEAARRSWGPEKHRLLAELKLRYDPQNLLRRNHNVLPAAA